MAAREGDYRVFIGGLSWDVTERDLEDAFRRYGKIIDCQIMMERDTGRPRGFGFLTFADRRGMEDAIREMHGRTFGDRAISVNKAQPKAREDSPSHGYGGGYSSLSRGSYRSSDRIERTDDCFKCGRPGHWARECPSASGGGGRGLNAPLSSRSRYGDVGGRGDSVAATRDRYIDDRYDGGRYVDKDRSEGRDKYGARTEYVSDRYAPAAADRYPADRYRGSDRVSPNGYVKDRGGYDRDVAPRRGSDKYGGGPIRSNVGKSYAADRPGPYDRPSRGGRPSSFDRY